MENKFTYFYNLLTTGLVLFILFQTSPATSQIPVEILPDQQISALPLGSSSSLIDCETAPVITCPSIYYGCPGDDIDPSNTGFATAISGDANCPDPIITYNDSIINTGSCAGEFEIQRLWTANYPDNTNVYLFAFCTQLISLLDEDGPEINNCPANILLAPSEDCNAIATWSEPTATDDCGLESLVSNYPSGSVFPLGNTAVTYTATDDCGNTSTCSFTVIVEGDCCFDAPSLICADDYIGCPSLGISPEITGQASASMGNEYCGETILTYEDELISSNACGEQEVIRTWTATPENDPSLVSTCTQTISLVDDKAPLLSNIPNDITVAPNDNCTAMVTWDDVIATDNCGEASLSYSIVNGSTFTEGTTNVVITATDACGNTETAQFGVTVSTCCNTPPSIECPNDYIGCPGADISVSIIENCNASPSLYTGWAVATCNAEAGTDEPVGVIYNISNTSTAPIGGNWAPQNIHPTNWTLGQIGQIFGIAIGANETVYLAASDIYDTQYNIDPYGPGQIFVARPENGFLAEPLVSLPNFGGPLNGIGNIAYDRINHQLFASNLEDGKIYRISLNGAILDTYDPWANDTGANGIAAQSEQVWGIALNIENGIQKLYFPRIHSTERSMYSIELNNGGFPTAGSETIAFTNIMGVGERISDIDFSSDGTQMIFAERGTQFLTGAHDSKMMKYDYIDGNWQMAVSYFVGSLVTDQYPSIPANTGENSAGGVTFGPTSVDQNINGCDELVWTTMNYLLTPDGNLHYGMQGIDVDGNNPSSASIDPNTATDFMIDFDGNLNTFEQKGDLGDVEVFDNGGYISPGGETGFATATSGGMGCGEPIITYADNLISEGDCDGEMVVERTWTAIDPEQPQLYTTCVQTITIEDNDPPVINGVPNDITLDPSTSCNAVATWVAPTAEDNCGIVSFSSNYDSGSVFSEGNTQVIYTAVDNCGQTTSSTFIVTVADCCSQIPIITCPSDYTSCPSSSIHPQDTGMAIAIAGSSNCGVPIISFSDDIVSTGACAGELEIIRTWVATDPSNSNLAASCTQSISLVDNTPPVIYNCPDDITITTTGSGTEVTWSEPTAIDDCGLEWIMADHQSGDFFPIGTTIVHYTAVDDCENVAPCTFSVTVEALGTIDCPDDIVVDCNDDTPIFWDLPIINTGCNTCNEGDSIPGFIYMGSLNGSLYYCSTSPATSSVANSVVANNGGHLATITTPEENDLLASFLNTQCALFGLSDQVHEGNFQWSTSEPLVYTNWAAYQPNDDVGNQDCAVLCTDGWYDSNCGVAYEYIMEIPCITYEQTSGLPNGSVFPLGIDTISYIVTDACGNELSCSFTVTVEESAELWCPSDTEFECPLGASGAYAYWETPELTSCCTDCSSGVDIPGFMYMGSHNGSQYYCSMANATWPTANVSAQSLGGHLAEINDAYENEFLANILTIQRAWIGLNDAKTEGIYKWTTGNSLGYSNWYPGQPNNKDNYQDYVSMLSDGYWNDEYNNLAMEYIVEIPCTSVTQIGGPVSGSYLPIGTTTVTYAGIDGCGNTDTCSFDITINGDATCDSYGLDTWYMWINNIGLGDYENVSGNNDGYGDFTSSDQCIDLHKGQTYPITLGPGFSESLYTVYWKVWIDYNQDGDYNDTNEYVAYGSGYQELNGNLPISNYANIGQTTMRIAMKYGGFPTGPCEVFTHGEVEDYCLHISGSSLKEDDSDMRSSETVIELSQTEFSKASLVKEVLGNQRSNTKFEETQFFPNPTTGLLYYKSNALGKTYHIFSSAGQKVKTITLESDHNSTIDLSDLEDGFYILKSIDNTDIQRIIITK